MSTRSLMNASWLRATLLIGQAGVVAQRLEPATREGGGQLVDLRAANAVDDAGLAAMASDGVEHLPQAIGARAHAIDQVRPVERRRRARGDRAGAAAATMSRRTRRVAVAVYA